MDKNNYFFLAGFALIILSPILAGPLIQLAISIGGYQFANQWVVVFFSHLSPMVSGLVLVYYSVVRKNNL